MPLNFIEFFLEPKASPSSNIRIIEPESALLANESAYMTEFVVRAVKSVRGLGCARINFFCTDQEIDREFLEFDRIINLKVPFNMDYFQMSVEEKKQYLFQLLTNSLQRLCELKGWDFSIFQAPLDELQANNLNVEYYVKNKSRRNGKYTAKIYCIHDMKQASFYIDFIEKRKVIQRKPLMVTEPYIYAYHYRIGEFKWIDDKTVSLQHKHSDKAICVSMDE